MQYPPDLEEWTGQERDEFRDFRHIIGDVLKDCAFVLGEQETLYIPFQLLTELVQKVYFLFI